MTIAECNKITELEPGWARMQWGITKVTDILEGKSLQFDSEEYIELYTTVYNMCLQRPPYDYSLQLYDRYSQTFNEYITTTVLPALRDKHGEYLLREIVKRWNNHCVMLRWLSRFFSYLDRYFVSKKNLLPLRDVGLTRFYDLVYQEMKSKVKDAAIDLIHREREGEQIDRSLLKNISSLFEEIGKGNLTCYERDFESFMLEDTGKYYARKATSWISYDSFPEYMLKAERCLNLEKQRVANYLIASSEPKLLERVNHELLGQHWSTLFLKEHSGCHVLLRDEKMDDLSRVYRLFRKMPTGLESVAQIFEKHIASEGLELVKQAEAAAKDRDAGKNTIFGAEEQAFMWRVIELHDKYAQYTITCFQNSSLFWKAIQSAFQTFCNKRIGETSNAQLLATFCDHILRKGGRDKLSDEAIEDMLEKLVRIFSFLHDKDLFQEFFRKKLANRLIYKTSANEDHESSILSKLKRESGPLFTNKMEGMVNDFKLIREDKIMFDEYLKCQPHLGLDFNVCVLQTGHWPTFQASELNLPPELVRCVEVYKQYYNRNPSNHPRKLTWIHSLASCTIGGNFDATSHDIDLSTQQAAVLMLFNDSQKLSCSEIMSRTRITQEEIANVIRPLSCMKKHKILIKEPSSEVVSLSDTFEFNAKFTDRMKRIKIPHQPLYEEKKKVIEDVNSDRKFLIDASLVRIMKSRKALTNQQLISECITQLTRSTFKPDVKQIKKRIDELITREYIERDRENPCMFKYKA